MTKSHIKKSELVGMYYVNSMSLREIADVYDVSVSTIWNYMERFDIKRRSRIELRFLQVVEEKKRGKKEMEINKEVEKEIKEKVKYLKKKIGATCTESQVVELALNMANRVGGDWGFVCEYTHGGLKK